MTSIAMSNYGMTQTLQQVRTTAVVVDRRSRRSRQHSGRSLADAVRAYYAAKFTILAGIVTVAMMAGAFIGQL